MVGCITLALRRIPTVWKWESDMPNDEWIKTLQDGRKVKFTNVELGTGSFITAQIENSEVVYSVLLDGEKNPLSRPEVESRFQAELSKK
jgi:hypothetical protein